MLRRLALLGVLLGLVGCGASPPDTVLAATAAPTSSVTAAPTQLSPASPSPTRRPGGDAAVWDLDPVAGLDAGSRSFRVLVTRLGCANGVTGNVLDPEIRESANEVVVTFVVAALLLGGYDCPGNNGVAAVVRLREPLGNRRLVDGACLDGPATRTSFCAEGGARRP